MHFTVPFVRVLDESAGLVHGKGWKSRLQVWIASCWTSFSTTYNWANATPENFNPIEAGVVDQLYVLWQAIF